MRSDNYKALDMERNKCGEPLPHFVRVGSCFALLTHKRSSSAIESNRLQAKETQQRSSGAEEKDGERKGLTVL